MYYLLCDKDCQKPEKYKAFDGSPGNGARHGKGEQQFENGCIYRGDFHKDAFHGSGEFVFPEGTKIAGFFDNNRFRKGTISLSIGLTISCITDTDYETFEDYFKEFRVGLAPDCFLVGFTGARGTLESAQVYVRGDPVASYQGTNLVFKIPGEQKTFLVVSKLWFYVGDLQPQSGDPYAAPVFDGRGSQIWFTGIGYNQGLRVAGQLHGTQLMLRHCAGLQFFRDMKYANGKFLSSITIFNNGLIFATEDDYFKGTLKIFLSNGDEAEFECALHEYSSLKLGVLRPREDEGEIKLYEKNGRTFFTVKQTELTLDEFKAILG